MRIRGLAMDPAENRAMYEIFFKTGKLTETYDDGLLLESKRERKDFCPLWLN